jgi:hypothetical protein
MVITSGVSMTVRVINVVVVVTVLDARPESVAHRVGLTRTKTQRGTMHAQAARPGSFRWQGQQFATAAMLGSTGRLQQTRNVCLVKPGKFLRPGLAPASTACLANTQTRRAQRRVCSVSLENSRPGRERRLASQGDKRARRV